MNTSKNNTPGVCFRRALNRRRILRGTGVGMSLPLLTSMSPAFADQGAQPAKRFVGMSIGLGLLGENLNPKKTGRGYKPSMYLKQLQDLRDKFTVVSGCSHPGVKGGHRAESSILSGTPTNGTGQAKNGISIDQLLAKHLGEATRFPSLILSTGGNTSPSYTESGAMISPESSPSRLFAKLFIDDSKKQRQIQANRVREGRSIMDLVSEDAKSLQREVGTADRDRLDSFFTSVRELEKRMAKNERWANLPKPKVKATRPVDIGSSSDLIGRQAMMSDVIRLALETDSTRFVTLHMPGAGGVLPIKGVNEAYHNLSHHGRDSDKLAQLALIEKELIGTWGSFIRGLNSVDEAGGSLLDQTTVFMTSNLGNASNHDNRNMPVLLAGGGFKHGQHLGFDQNKNYPLPNLFVSVLQNIGLERDAFATSTGTMKGLA